MEGIYQGKIFTSHHQLALIDNQDPGAYPQWAPGADQEMRLVFGPKGVAVATASDRLVQVSIYRGPGKGRGVFLGAGEIEIGGLGLNLGGLADVDLIDWPAGRTAIAVYANRAAPGEATHVTFVLEPLNGSAPEYNAAEAVAGRRSAEQNVAERVKALLAQYQHQTPYKQDEASAALGKLGPAAIPALIQALQAADPGVRVMAAAALGRCRAASALGRNQTTKASGDSQETDPSNAVQAALCAALQDPQGAVRRAAAQALGVLKDRRAVPALVTALQDREVGVRQQAAASLGRLGDSSAGEALLACFQDKREDWNVRESAALALGELGVVKAIEPLVAAARQVSDSRRYMLRKALITFGPRALPAVYALLQDQEPGIRRWAAFVLGGFRNRRKKGQVVQHLLVALHDPAVQVRAAAAGALGELYDPQAAQPLVAALEDRHREVRYAAASALINLAGTEQLPALLKVQQHDPDRQVREAAGRAIQAALARE